MAKKFNSKDDVTQKLKFKPDPNKLGGLCLGRLTDVTVEYSTTPKVDEKGNPSNWEYAGMKYPRILFIFKQINNSETDPERFHFHSEQPVTQKKNDGTPVEKSKIDGLYSALFDRLIHIYSAYKGAPNYKDIELETEIDETADAETRAKQMTSLFKELAAAFNKAKGDKPIFKDKDGMDIPMYMKLIADYKKGTTLVFPTYVGEGFIEMKKGNQPPVIEIKPNESIVLTSKKTAPSQVASGSKAQEDLPEDVRKYLDELEGK